MNSAIEVCRYHIKTTAMISACRTNHDGRKKGGNFGELEWHQAAVDFPFSDSDLDFHFSFIKRKIRPKNVPHSVTFLQVVIILPSSISFSLRFFSSNVVQKLFAPKMRRRFLLKN